MAPPPYEVDAARERGAQTIAEIIKKKINAYDMTRQDHTHSTSRSKNIVDRVNV